MTWRGLFVLFFLALQLRAADLPVFNENSLLIVEVHLDDSIISEGISIYKKDGKTWFPLSELFRSLSFAIELSADRKSASGWYISEDRKFEVNFEKNLVDNGVSRFSISKSNWIFFENEIYVSEEEFSKWFPLNFSLDQPGLILSVLPKEKLPLQLQIERNKLAKQFASAESGDLDPGFPENRAPYKLFDLPVWDQRFGAGVSKTKDSSSSNFDYTSTFAGDLLWTQSSLVLGGENTKKPKLIEYKMGRTDPAGALLGPLKAREVFGGKIPLPSHPRISQAPIGDLALTISNRKKNQPSRFDSYRIQGTLLAGWDVMLYHNGVAVRYDQSSEDKQYDFQDLPLYFGYNDFLLVFNGPFGEKREERKRFFLDSSFPRKDEFFYDLGFGTNKKGETRYAMVAESNLAKNFALGASYFALPLKSEMKSFAALGIRAFGPSLFVGQELLISEKGGPLFETTAKTHLGSALISLNQTFVRGFESEIFLESPDPVEQISSLRMDYSLPWPLRIPTSTEVKRQYYASKESEYSASEKLSFFVAGTGLTYEIRGSKRNKVKTAAHSGLVSKRLGAWGIRGEVSASIYPDKQLEALELGADTRLGQNYQLNSSLSRSFSDGVWRAGAGVVRSIGSFMVGLNLSKSTNGESQALLQFFSSLGIESRQKTPSFSHLARSETGAVSAKVFLDSNVNGQKDLDEKTIEGVGFVFNGTKLKERSNKDGIAFIEHLPAGDFANLSVDGSTLEEVQQSSGILGQRIVPRPGRVQEIDFPIIITTEIDGSVFLVNAKKKSPVSDAEVEVVAYDNPDKVISTTKSSSDGFYILTGVPPGHFQIRIKSEQLNRLGLKLLAPINIQVSPEAGFVNGQDLFLEKEKTHL